MMRRVAMMTHGLSTRRWLLAVVCALGVSAPGVVHAVTDCTGVADNTPCDENGDGCYFNHGQDQCLAGKCASPPPCARTTFTPLAGGKTQMQWERDPATITPGEYCEGNVFVTVAQVQAIAGITPPSPDGLVPVTRARKNRRNVPPSGKVQLKLRLNNLGRLMLGRAATFDAVARMTLVKPDGKVAGAANRAIALRRR